MSKRTAGRHAAPKVRRSHAVAAAATSAALGMTATAAVAAPASEEDAAPAPLALDAEVVEVPAVIDVELPEDAAVELASINVTSTEAPEPVVEPEPIVEPEPVVEETPVVEATPAAETTTEDAATTQAPAATTTTTQTATVQEAAPEPEPEPVQAAPAATGYGSTIVGIARQYSGVPYVYGGTTPSGWDCSGFTSYVFAQAGISLPRSSSAQRYAGYQVSASQAQPGDLVWWPGHVGIYTGNGMHIAARNPSSGTYEGPVYGSPVYIRVAG